MASESHSFSFFLQWQTNTFQKSKKRQTNTLLNTPKLHEQTSIHMGIEDLISMTVKKQIRYYQITFCWLRHDVHEKTWSCNILYHHRCPSPSNILLTSSTMRSLANCRVAFSMLSWWAQTLAPKRTFGSNWSDDFCWWTWSHEVLFVFHSSMFFKVEFSTHFVFRLGFCHLGAETQPQPQLPVSTNRTVPRFSSSIPAVFASSKDSFKKSSSK